MIKKTSVLHSVTSLGLWIFYTLPAYAQATDVGNVFDSMSIKFGTIPIMLTVISYITGMGFTIMGLIKMRDYVDDPSQNFMKDALARLGIGSLLILLPFAIKVAALTIGGFEAGIARPEFYDN